MTISDFSLLRLTEQLAILYVDGIYLAKRRSGKMTVLLFQLHNVYVEIFYTKYRRVVHHTRYSESTKILEPYLGPIQIDSLFSTDS